MSPRVKSKSGSGLSGDRSKALVWIRVRPEYNGQDYVRTRVRPQCGQKAGPNVGQSCRSVDERQALGGSESHLSVDQSQS